MDKESLMKKQIGLWIDHRKAIIVIITEDGEGINMNCSVFRTVHCGKRKLWRAKFRS